MKSLHEIKNRLQQFRFEQSQKIQKNHNTQSRTLISKSFSKDEDLFLFI
ncbi:hypothetical protein [Psychroserpens luteus]|uniref:Uncharacterized protein n=1 Tax=Psychroserpens luteus TaxID=1434066 RepID=A0ABW5ZSA3_9FLAO|nr:hypothetical protein [Psychroserpens luteus]